MTAARKRLIRDAAIRDVDADGFRDRLDEWMSCDTIEIIWQRTVDIHQQAGSFWAGFEETGK